MAKTTNSKKHNWRAYGRQDGTVVCDDCNLACDVNDLIVDELSQTLKELKEEIDDGKRSHSMAVISGAIDNKIEEIKR